MKNIYRIMEYGSFIREKEITGYTSLPQNTFDALENFILSSRDNDGTILEFMGLSAKKGIGKIITAKNYVGVISMRDGTVIEILPKIYSKESSNIEKTKRLLLDMLKCLKDSPYKSLQTTKVDIENMNILEVFIRMFIDEVFFIVKRGLKNGYETIQSNETVLKGKLKFTEQIRCNYAHKERCFIECDDFNRNRVENRIVKAALLYLYRTTHSAKNKKDIKMLLDCLIEIEPSVDYDSDFSKIVPDRNTKDYTLALKWSKVFLKGKSFTSFAGSEVAVALLFPMEILFESYIAAQLRKILHASEYSLLVQDKTHHLFEASRQFLLKPDLVIKHKTDNRVYIIDTKWKVLSASKPNYGILQADMYQMYAYQKKYSADSVTLLYPYVESISPEQESMFHSEDGSTIRICFVDVFDVRNSLSSGCLKNAGIAS